MGGELIYKLKHRIVRRVYKNPDIVLRKIGDECLLVPVKNIIDNGYILRLNKMGAYIWEVMDHAKSVDEIKSFLKEKYGTVSEIEQDLEEFLLKLEKLGLVNIGDS